MPKTKRSRNNIQRKTRNLVIENEEPRQMLAGDLVPASSLVNPGDVLVQIEGSAVPRSNATDNRVRNVRDGDVIAFSATGLSIGNYEVSLLYNEDADPRFPNEFVTFESNGQAGEPSQLLETRRDSFVGAEWDSFRSIVVIDSFSVVEGQVTNGNLRVSGNDGWGAAFDALVFRKLDSDPSVQFSLESDVKTARVGEVIDVRIQVSDERIGGAGAFAAFVDATFDSQKLRLVEIVNSVGFPNAISGTIESGLANEVGGVAGVAPSARSEELALLRFSVLAEGFTQIHTSSADLTPAHDILLRDSLTPVANEEVGYGSLTLEIQPRSSLQNSGVSEDVNRDGHVTPIDALIVINWLNADDDTSLYPDVDGNGIITPVDALRVLNHLNHLNRSTSVVAYQESVDVIFGGVEEEEDAEGMFQMPRR